MSFWVVPGEQRRVDALVLRVGHVEPEQPGRGGVDRHGGVHLADGDRSSSSLHVAEVGHGDADLADLAGRLGRVGVVPGLGRQVEGDGEARLALGQVGAVELVGGAGGGMARIGAHHPRRVTLRRSVAIHVTSRRVGRTTILPGPAFPAVSAAATAAVVVEALLGLAAELARGDQAAQQRHRGVVGIAVLLVERIEDGQRGVEPDQVEQRERAHGEPATALHGGVDALLGRHALLEQAHRVVEVREQEGVHDEAGLVLHFDRVLAAARRRRRSPPPPWRRRP